MPDDERLVRALVAIDQANADDPTTIEVAGQVRSKELVHAELMSAWVIRLDPQADDAQRLAARAHHLRRWEIPRQDYPDGRAGYLRWRTRQKARHAELVADILRDCGYGPETIERVGQIIRKEHLRTDPAVQVHEDALCLTFLETQLGVLGAQLGGEKAEDVLAKTLAKMTPAGRALIDSLDLSADERALIARAAPSA